MTTTIARAALAALILTGLFASTAANAGGRDTRPETRPETTDRDETDSSVSDNDHGQKHPSTRGWTCEIKKGPDGNYVPYITNNTGEPVSVASLVIYVEPSNDWRRYGLEGDELPPGEEIPATQMTSKAGSTCTVVITKART